MDKYAWVGKSFRKERGWRLLLAMATNRKILLDDALAGSALETELKKHFRKVYTLSGNLGLPKGADDKTIARAISKKRFIFLTPNYKDFFRFSISNFDLLGVDSGAGSPAVADRWAKALKLYVAKIHIEGRGTRAVKLTLKPRRPIK